MWHEKILEQESHTVRWFWCEYTKISDIYKESNEVGFRFFKKWLIFGRHEHMSRNYFPKFRTYILSQACPGHEHICREHPTR